MTMMSLGAAFARSRQEFDRATQIIFAIHVAVNRRGRLR
jgi:hypothetical protein